MSGSRDHSMDVVRAGALLLGIVLHSTISFWPGFREANWPISDDSSSLTLAGLYFVAHIFRMSLFFCIAGYFAHALVVRLGAWNFVKNRLRRIGLPFIVAMVVVMPLLILPFLWGQRQLGVQAMPNVSPPIPDPQLPPWGHLWFLYLLLVMYALSMAARALMMSLDRRRSMRDFIENLLGAVLASRAAPVVLAAPAALLLYDTPWWLMWQGIPAPIMGFIPNLPALLAFGTAFGFGWFLHRRPGWLALLKRDWLLYLLAAAALSAVSLIIVGPRPQLHVHALPELHRAGYSAAYNVAVWCWVLGLIGVAARYLDRPSAHWRYLADASFFVYIMHLPVVYALQALVMKWPLHWSMKYLLVVGATTAVTLLLYHYLVRSTFVGQLLNGRRYPRASPFTSRPSTSPG